MTASAFASGISQKQGKLNDVHKNITDSKKNLNQVKDQQDNVQNQLKQVDQSLQEKQKELSAVENQLNQTQGELSATRQNLAVTENNLANTRENLDKLQTELNQSIKKAEEQEKLNADRMRAMYMNSDSSYLELLFESKGLNDLMDRVDMITKMFSYDQGVFDELTQYRDEVKKKKEACEQQKANIEQCKRGIENQKAALEQKESEIQNTKAQIAKQKQDIEATQNEKQRLITQLDAEKAKISEDLDAMEAESKNLEKEIRRLVLARQQQQQQQQQQRQASRGSVKRPGSGVNNVGSKYTGGRLAWPAPGFYTITSPYGWRNHPIEGVEKLHKGMDISGGGIAGHPAKAAADGTVILIQHDNGRKKGYGNMVTVDHGGGITTTYAHGSAIKVSVGQKVKAGDTVILVGSTGGSTGPHLHFEVRVNGTPVNPMGYLQ